MAATLSTSCQQLLRRPSAHSSTNRHTSGRNGGQWGYCSHLKEYGLNFDFGLANALIALAPSDSFELGCGLGLYSSWLQRMAGADPALGVEPNPMPVAIFGDPAARGPLQLVANLVNSSDATVRTCRASLKFDLALSLEVAEHAPRILHSDFADLLAVAARKFVVLSAGHPGQPGRGHISNRKAGEWVEEFRRRGLSLLWNSTGQFRLVARNIRFRQNLLVFAKCPDGQAVLERKRGQMVLGCPIMDRELYRRLTTDAGAGAHVPAAVAHLTDPTCRSRVGNSEEKGDRDACHATHVAASERTIDKLASGERTAD